MLIRTLATVLTATLLTIVLALFLSGQAFADSWKDESGHGRWHGAYHKHGGYHKEENHWRGHHGKHRDNHRSYAYRDSHWKREYWDGPCKIEEKSGPGGYKKEIKCRPAHHHYGQGHYHRPVDIAWLLGPLFSQVMPGEALVWQDPTYGDRYQVVPTRDYQTAQGRYCREYQATATVGGRPQQTYGTACLQPDGSWQIVQ